MLLAALRRSVSSSSQPALLGLLAPSATRYPSLLNSRYLTSSACTYAQNDTFSALKTTSAQFKTYKPITPSIRHLRRPLSPHLYEGRPVRLLTIAQRKKGGRGAHGRVSVRSRGGGHKRRLRVIDFVRAEPGVQDVIRIEYDPGRSAHIALLKSRALGSPQPYSYILACEGMRAGDTVQSFRQGIPDGLVPGYVDSGAKKRANPTAIDPSTPQTVTTPSMSASESASASLSMGVLRALTIKPGNVLPLRLIPTGTLIHSISLQANGRGILVRSAGSFGQLVSHDDSGAYSQVKLQSGEVRHVLQSCCATIGKVSNADWKNRSLGKAGRSRWLGRRPHVRGVAMNACDHPHGGGRGKSKGNKHPRSVWGWLTKGKRTRKPAPKGKGNHMVVRERPRGKDRTN